MSKIVEHEIRLDTDGQRYYRVEFPVVYDAAAVNSKYAEDDSVTERYLSVKLNRGLFDDTVLAHIDSLGKMETAFYSEVAGNVDCYYVSFEPADYPFDFSLPINETLRATSDWIYVKMDLNNKPVVPYYFIKLTVDTMAEIEKALPKLQLDRMKAQVDTLKAEWVFLVFKVDTSVWAYLVAVEP